MNEKSKAPELSREEKIKRIETLEAKYGVTVDVTNITLGDLADLQNEDTSFMNRLDLIQGMLSTGEARKIKLLDLSEFMDVISYKIDLASNPT